MRVEDTEPARPAAGPPSPRPHAVAAVVPAASVPLSFLAAAAAGLAGPATGPGQPASRAGTNPAHDSRGIPRTRSSGPA